MRVKSNRTTWLLFLLAFAAAGVMATWSIAQRARERPAPRPERATEVELELVD